MNNLLNAPGVVTKCFVPLQIEIGICLFDKHGGVIIWNILVEQVWRRY